MNMPPHVALVSARAIDEGAQEFSNVTCIIAPTLFVLSKIRENINHVSLAAANFYPAESGNVTGEVPITDIQDVVSFAIIGHSERRTLLSEDNSLIREKIQSALEHNITPILCIGESAEERRFGKTPRVLHDQLEKNLPRIFSVSKEILIAYEPLWAISGGTSSRVAEPQEIAEAIKYIKDFLNDRYGKAASQFHVLYGGSMDTSNASSLFHIQGIAGALVGKASLDSKSFLSIAQILNEE
jgi:triosephosphate isomerase